ncbi:hypothetical protein GO300_05167 [Ralstonia solanacearum]|nr:hypothetical protein [Ralstonia solanacearum]
MRPGPDRHRHRCHDGDARGERARREDRLVAPGRQGCADLARPGQAGLGVCRPGVAGDPAGGRLVGDHPAAAGRQGGGLGCSRRDRRGVRRRRLPRRRRAGARGAGGGRHRVGRRAGGRGLGNRGRAGYGLHALLWRRLALLLAVGQVAGVDRRAVESRPVAVCHPPVARYLSGGLAQGGNSTAEGQAGELIDHRLGREDRPLGSQARGHGR